MRTLPCALLLLLLGLLPGRGAGADGTITVFAAASLSDALKEIAATHEKRTGESVRLNLGASSTLARQIEEGAPADLFFSADEAQMDRLTTRGLIRTNTRVTRLSNSLVIVLSAENVMSFPSAASLTNPAIRRIALAEPKTVPAGVYAREFLIARKLWSTVEPKIIPTANVRAALAAVESGNVEAAIVYQTDARLSKKVRVAHEVPAADGPRVRYPVAVTRDAPNAAAAERFLQFLNSPEADRAFARFGFIVVPRSP